MRKDRILIVDDEKDMATGLQRLVTSACPEVTVEIADDSLQALEIFRADSFDVALLDIQMPGMDGLELMEEFRKIDALITVVMMTAYGSIEVAVEAMKRGAYDFVTKPFEKDALLRIIRKARERNRLLRENVSLRERICDQEALEGFIGQSPVMKNLSETLKTAAQTDYTILIRGESGTGKELAARAIHKLSRRRNKELVMVNCPAIPEHLLESELFGHRKGAFTGADRDRQGLFARADGGTICLDEIADIPVTVQTKLLRVLQEQEIKPLGDSKTTRIDVRVIAITNQNLEEKIERQTFREDLFYRLNVVGLRTPPLREIREDIPLIANHLVRQVACELGTVSRRISPAAHDQLVAASWKGNVRELQNVIRQSVIFCSGDSIEPADLKGMDGRFFQEQAAAPPGNDLTLLSYKAAKERIVRGFTDDYVRKLLAKTGGNVTRAARISGLTRAALQKIMRRLDIVSDHFREEN